MVAIEVHVPKGRSASRLVEAIPGVAELTQVASTVLNHQIPQTCEGRITSLQLITS